MKRYFLTKFASLATTLLSIIVIVFIMVRLTGIDPCRIPKATDKFIAECHERWGLDQPIPIQLGRYLGNLATLDLGESYQHAGKTVSELILEALPKTLSIVFIVLLLSFIIGSWAGMQAALKRNTRTDYGIMGFAMIGLAVPEMVIGPVLVLLFTMVWHLLPRSGLESPLHFILPVTMLVITHTADIARLARSGMLEVLHEDFIRTARAKGLRERTVLWRHTFRLGITPVVSYLGPLTANTMAGGIFIVEALLGIPGVSFLFIDAAANDPMDFPMIMGSTIMLATLILVMNFIVDLIYAVLNPRIRDEITEDAKRRDGFATSLKGIAILIALVVCMLVAGRGLVWLIAPVKQFGESIARQFSHTTLLLSIAWFIIGIVIVRSYGRAKRTKVGTSFAADAWRRLAKHRVALAGGVILFAMVFISLFVPWLMEHAFGVTFDHQDLYHTSEAPPFAAWFGAKNASTWLHIVGTDENGRDLFVRTLLGLRTSLMIGITSLIVTVSIGVVFGTIAGYAGGSTDNVMMRFVDMLYSTPYLIIVILLTKIVGREPLLLFIALGFVSWLTLARVTRGQVLTLKRREFIEASRAIGARWPHIVFRHLIPNTLGPVVIYATRLMAVIILGETFLSFLGFGIQDPDASLGLLINLAVRNMQQYWWMIVAPTVALAILLYSLNYLGDGLRDALDPKLRGTK